MTLYVALGNHGGWGKGETPAVAKREARKHGLSDLTRKVTFTVIEFPDAVEFVGVDEFGRVHWKGDGDNLALVVEDHTGVLWPHVKVGEYA